MQVKTDLSPLLKALTDITAPDEVASVIEGVTDEVFLETRDRALRLGSRLGPRIARSLRTTVNGLEGEVLAAEADGYVGLHVHQGGSIRSRNGKVLAIPTKWNPDKETFARNRDDLQLIKSKKRQKIRRWKRGISRRLVFANRNIRK